MLSLLEQKKMPKDSPILVRIFKEESELEVWKQDTTGHFQILKVYPICRWSGDLGPKVHEGDRQAPEGFYTITPGLMNPNSNYYLAINTGFPNAFDKANDRHGALPHDPWRLLVARLLRHDRRADRRNLFAGARIVPRRPAVIPDPGLSVPHDAGEPGAPSHQSEHGVLEDDQGRQRSLRGDTSRTQGRRLRPALRVRRGAAGESRRPSCSIRPAAARLMWSIRKSPARRWRKSAPTRPNTPSWSRSNRGGRAGPFRPRRRHEPGVPGAGRRRTFRRRACRRRARCRRSRRRWPSPTMAAARWRANCSAAFFGPRSTQTQVAATDSATQERGAEPATTGTTPKARSHAA